MVRNPSGDFRSPRHRDKSVQSTDVSAPQEGKPTTPDTPRESSRRPTMSPRRIFVILSVLVALVVPFTLDGTLRTAAFVMLYPVAVIGSGRLLTTTTIRAAVSIAMMIVLSLGVIHAIRCYIFPDAFYGELPDSVAIPFHVVIVSVSFLLSFLIWLAFQHQGQFRRTKWMIVAFAVLLLTGLGYLTQGASIGMTPMRMLASIDEFEDAVDPDSFQRQQASVFLAACGRATEAEAISRWHVPADPDSAIRPRVADIDRSELTPLDWRSTLRRIAEQERLLLIMEAHNAPKHRQWIEQALPILHEAGFRDYAAETLSPPTRSLMLRGYPTSMTGYYSADPSFGNLLRVALELNFRIHAYESIQRTPEAREKGQALHLAQILSSDPKMKLVVHAGYAHVFKRNHPDDLRTMASYLWEETGIEPYTIYQSWHSREELESRELSKLLAAEGEPRMLEPPPGLPISPQFNFAEGAIDALVIHHPSSGDAATRSHAFPRHRVRVTGTWNGNQWPILIAAVVPEESDSAIPLDQVLLRENERQFQLWLPVNKYELRVYDRNGIVASGASQILFDGESEP